MLTIRLQRTGRKNSPQFRLVLMEKRSAVKSAAKEILGSYDPKTKKLSIIDQNRVEYWAITQRIPLSPTANNLLVGQKIIAGAKVKSFSVPKKKEETKEEAPKAQVAPAAKPTTVAPVEAVEAPVEVAVEVASSE